MELPEVSRALNDWQRMRNYNAELLAEQTRLIKERDALAEALQPFAEWYDHLSAIGSRKLEDYESPDVYGWPSMGALRKARALLAKHGR